MIRLAFDAPATVLRGPDRQCRFLRWISFFAGQKHGWPDTRGLHFVK
jgi:hypothetical protein